jgi:hypothetical protein
MHVTPSRRKNIPGNPEDLHVLEFEGYNAEDVEHENDRQLSRLARFIKLKVKPEKEVNSVVFSDNLERKEIELGVKIENSELKGKNVFPQVRKLIAENFPQGFSLMSKLRNEKKCSVLCEIWRKIRDKELSIDEAKAMLRSDNVIQGWYDAGFTDIRLAFDEFLGEEFYLYRQKNEGQERNFVFQIGKEVY